MAYIRPVGVDDMRALIAFAQRESDMRLDEQFLMRMLFIALRGLSRERFAAYFPGSDPTKMDPFDEGRVSHVRQTTRQLVRMMFASDTAPDGDCVGVAVEWHPISAADLVINRESDGSYRQSIVVRASRLTWPEAAAVGIATVIERWGNAIGECIECKASFVKVGRQEYCSTSCSQKARSRRWYAANREAVLEKRHGEYASEQQARLGAKVKVARRKRVSRAK